MTTHLQNIAPPETASVNNALILTTSALLYATEAHKGQVRKELNEPYIIHPIRVGRMAAQYGLGGYTVAAAYLHDVIEDCGRTEYMLRDAFPAPTVKCRHQTMRGLPNITTKR